MNEKKSLDEMTITELKAVLFDIDQQIKTLQYNYQQVGKQLEQKLNDEQKDIEKNET